MSDIIQSKINLKEKESGEFDFYTRPLEENEKNFYGIFISHSSADNEKYLYPLRDTMRERELYPLCDRDFLSGGDDYQAKIESNLNCYAAVAIITPSSLSSDWVNYEIGILTGKGVPVFLWDPENVLNYDDEQFRDYINLHLEKFLPAYNDMNELIDKLEEISPYAEMFSEENAFLDCETFSRRMSERVETVIVTIESEIFDEHYSYFAECDIGTLVPNFGMFYTEHGDGEHCFSKGGVPLKDGLCHVNGRRCALYPEQNLTEENKECVLLNHVLYNGKLLRKGQKDFRGVVTEVGSMVFHLPVHRYYGIEFKFIIDVPDNTIYDKVMSLLEEAGMNPSAPASMVGGRIYLSLPSRKRQGLFRLVHEYENNFLCPHAVRKKN